MAVRADAPPVADPAADERPSSGQFKKGHLMFVQHPRSARPPLPIWRRPAELDRPGSPSAR